MIISKTNAQKQQKSSFGNCINIKAKAFTPEHDFLLKMKHKIVPLIKDRADINLGVINCDKDRTYFSIFASQKTNSKLGQFIKKITGENELGKRFSLPKRILRNLLGAKPTSRVFSSGFHRTGDPFTQNHEQNLISQITFAVRDFQDNVQAQKNNQKPSLMTRAMDSLKAMYHDTKKGQVRHG